MLVSKSGKVIKLVNQKTCMPFFCTMCLVPFGNIPFKYLAKYHLNIVANIVML